MIVFPSKVKAGDWLKGMSIDSEVRDRGAMREGRVKRVRRSRDSTILTVASFDDGEVIEHCFDDESWERLVVERSDAR